MLVKATKSFSGTISMASGDTREIPEGAVLNDLLRAGLIVEAEPAAKEAAPAEDKTENANEENAPENGEEGAPAEDKTENANEENAPENGEEGAPAEEFTEVKPREAKRNKSRAD